MPRCGRIHCFPLGIACVWVSELAPEGGGFGYSLTTDQEPLPTHRGNLVAPLPAPYAFRGAMVSVQAPTRVLLRTMVRSVFTLHNARSKQNNPARIDLNLLLVYQRHGSTCIGSVTLRGSIPTLWLSDAQAIKTIAFEPGIFRKDLEIVRIRTFPRTRVDSDLFHSMRESTSTANISSRRKAQIGSDIEGWRPRRSMRELYFCVSPSPLLILKLGQQRLCVDGDSACR